MTSKLHFIDLRGQTWDFIPEISVHLENLYLVRTAVLGLIFENTGFKLVLFRVYFH